MTAVTKLAKAAVRVGLKAIKRGVGPRAYSAGAMRGSIAEKGAREARSIATARGHAEARQTSRLLKRDIKAIMREEGMSRTKAIDTLRERVGSRNLHPYRESLEAGERVATRRAGRMRARSKRGA